MEIERETNKYEIINFMMSMKYYIAKGKKKYNISYHEIHANQKKWYIYIYIYEDWERDNQIRDWQFQDSNEILYRQKEEDDISYHEIHQSQI